MTYEEAISIVRCWVRSRGAYTDHATWQTNNEAAKLAIEALEKQVPKKPLHMHRNYYCPVCKEDGWLLWDDAIPNNTDDYCVKCGQAILWEDTE